jgi:hypothetical protein
MVKIWLIPLVDDHQFLSLDKPKRKESSSTHGKDFCGKTKKKVPESTDFEKKNSEIAILRHYALADLPKYNRILKFF